MTLPTAEPWWPIVQRDRPKPRITSARVALAAAAAALPPAGAGFIPIGLGDTDLLGLNKRGNLNLRGVGDGTGVGVGVGDASTLLRVRFGFGEAAGDSAAEADAVPSAGEVISVVSFVRCFDGEADSLGGVPVSSCDSTRATQIVRPITKVTRTRARFLVWHSNSALLVDLVTETLRS